MDNIDLKKHYLTFKWAVSKKWKHKNGLYKSIQYKIQILTKEYGLSTRDIIDELFADYWERGHYHKYDEKKGSFNNWIANYVNLYLNNLIRRHAVRSKDVQDQRIDPMDPRNQAKHVSLDKDNEKDDPDFQPDLVIDPTNPEDLLIAKETIELANDHFKKNEIDYFMGEIDLVEAASISGISCEAFRKRLDRRRVDFLAALEAIERI